jgi:hypothetical protein
MKKPCFVVLWIAFFTACATPAALSAQTVPDKQVVRQARQAYYNLRNEGLAEFECSITPNWKAILGDLSKSDPAAADRALKTLSELRFSLRVGRDSKVQLTHNDIPAQNQQVADGLRQIYGGMEQMITGFFDHWSSFMLSHPFPDVASEYRLQDVGPQYVLSYKDGATTDIRTTMGKDFAISDLTIKSAEFDSTIQPKFARTPKGLLFTSYEASYQSASPGDTTHLKVQIGYQEVDGLQLVHELNLRGVYGGNPFAVELTFSECKVTRNAK